MTSKKGYRLDGSTVDITISDLYWEEAVDLGLAGKAVDDEVFAKCSIQVMTEVEFDDREAILKGVHDSIKKGGHQKGFHVGFEWTRTPWLKNFLIFQGFRTITTSTLLVVTTAKGYEIKYIYWREPAADASDMLRLCKYTYDTSEIKGAAGQYVVDARGDKTMNGTMLAYGAHDVYGKAVQGGKTEPRMYNPSAKVDPKLNVLVTKHVDSLTAWEQKMIPGYAAVRDNIAAAHDPGRLHRMTPNSSAFAMTTSINYVVDPHNDSGAACELIMFANRNGPLPPGHEWLFAIGGAILELPTHTGEAVIMCVKGEGVYHGTLPTSSFEASYAHGNYGSALITKKQMINSLQRQAARGETTATKYQSSELYFGPGVTGGKTAGTKEKSQSVDTTKIRKRTSSQVVTSVTPLLDKCYGCDFDCGYHQSYTREGYAAVLAHERRCRMRK